MPKAKAPSRSMSQLWHKGIFEGQLPKFPSRDPNIPSWSKQEYSNPALSSLLGLATEDWRCPGPQNPTLITSTEPRVTLTVAGKPISFLIDTEATYSAVPDCSGKTKVSQVSIMGVDGLISTPRITEPLPCTLQDTPFPILFSYSQNAPLLFLGETFSQNSKPLLLFQVHLLI